MKENENDECAKFIFTNVQKGTGQALVDIQLFEGGKPTKFEPPGRQGKPYATKTNSSSITIAWKESPHGGEFVEMYAVHFKTATSGPSTDWTSPQTVGSQTVTTVDGLDAETP